MDNQVTVLPDGSAFATASGPLPKDHWLYAPRGDWDSKRDDYAETPQPILTNAQRQAVTAAGRYAVRGATMCGTEMDFDPDALVLNLCYALCGPAGGEGAHRAMVEPDMAERDDLIADNERLMQIAAQEVSAAEVPMPQGYAERPADYSGGIWIESHMRQYGEQCRAAGIAAEVPMPEHVEQLAITRYRPVPNGMFGYKVVAGDGTRSVFEGTKSECTLIARKLTEAFLDGAHVAGDTRESAGYAAGLEEADKLLLEAPRWRDVADELPQEAQEVLFVRSGKTVHGAWIGGIFWHNNQKMAAAKRMPLPAPQTDAIHALLATMPGAALCDRSPRP